MARHIHSIISDWWDKYSLPILLLLTTALLLGHRVETTNGADLGTVPGFYGPGNVIAWMITIFSMLTSGSGHILFLKWQRAVNTANHDDSGEIQREPRTLNEWNQLSPSEKTDHYRALWPPERYELRLWDAEAVVVASYAIIAYLHITSKWWSKDDALGMAFSCSSQAVAAHNIILLVVFISHLVLLSGHMQDHHPIGHDHRRGTSFFFFIWGMLVQHGTLVSSIWSMRLPVWMHFWHSLAFTVPLLLEVTRQGGIGIVWGTKMMAVYIATCAFVPFVMRLASKLPPLCDGISIVFGFPFPKSGVAWTDLDQIAAIAGATGGLLYKCIRNNWIDKMKHYLSLWKHEASKGSKSMLSVPDRPTK